MDRVLFIIKPIAFSHQDHVIHELTSAGFVITNKSCIELSSDQAAEFSNEQEAKVLTSGPILVSIIQKFGCLEQISTTIGKLKETFGDNFYSSCDIDTAEKDIRYFFPDGISR